MVLGYNDNDNGDHMIDRPIHLILQAGGSSALLMDLAANEKSVHGDFFNGKSTLTVTIANLLPVM